MTDLLPGTTEGIPSMGISLASDTYFLPGDVWKYILLYIDTPHDYFSCRLVCKSWKRVMESEEWYGQLYAYRMFTEPRLRHISVFSTTGRRLVQRGDMALFKTKHK